MARRSKVKLASSLFTAVRKNCVKESVGKSRTEFQRLFISSSVIFTCVHGKTRSPRLSGFQSHLCFPRVVDNIWTSCLFQKAPEVIV